MHDVRAIPSAGIVGQDADGPIWAGNRRMAKMMGASLDQEGFRIFQDGVETVVYLGREARILGENCSCVCRIAISTKGDRLAAYGLDGKLRVCDMDTGRSRTVGEYFGVNAISFMNSNRALVTASDDGTLRLF